jgi:hypothetical protein
MRIMPAKIARMRVGDARSKSDLLEAVMMKPKGTRRKRPNMRPRAIHRPGSLDRKAK